MVCLLRCVSKVSSHFFSLPAHLLHSHTDLNSFDSIFTNYGMALVSSDWMIDHICDENNDYLVPDVLKHQLLIYRFSGRVNNYMSSPVPRTSGLSRSQDSMSALGILEQEFMDIFRSLSGNLTGILPCCTGLVLKILIIGLLSS